MRWLVSILAVALLDSSAAANQIVSVPYTIEPGSVRFYTTGDADPEDVTGLSLPIVSTIEPDPSAVFCGPGWMAVTVEIVGGAVEVEFDGDVATADGPCPLGATLQMTADVVAPELGGTVTSLTLIPEIVTSDIVAGASYNASARYDQRTTSSFPSLARFGESGPESTVSAGSTCPLPGAPSLASGLSNEFVPGDTSSGVFTLTFSGTGGLFCDYDATLRIRFEMKSVVPEPSASLSLPIAVAVLARLASASGGSR